MTYVKQPLVLSIQSHMVHGRSGNRSAVFPMEASGIDCDVLNTCQFSAHTAYPVLKGTVLSTEEFREIIDGLRLNNILPDYTHLLTGYIADAAIAQSIYELRQQLGSQVQYVCDPVLGDWGKLYNSHDCLQQLKESLIPVADVITPNAYEAMWLTGKTMKNLSDLLDIVNDLHKMGPQTVVITSTEWNHRITFFSWNNGKNQIGIETPSMPRKFDGPGDVFTALFVANSISFPGQYKTIAKRTINSMYGVLEKTFEMKNRELSLPQSIGCIINPPDKFPILELADIEKLDIEDISIASKI